MASSTTVEERFRARLSSAGSFLSTAIFGRYACAAGKNTPEKASVQDDDFDQRPDIKPAPGLPVEAVRVDSTATCARRIEGRASCAREELAANALCVPSWSCSRRRRMRRAAAASHFQQQKRPRRRPRVANHFCLC
jgi:hypothetical protein